MTPKCEVVKEGNRVAVSASICAAGALRGDRIISGVLMVDGEMDEHDTEPGWEKRHTDCLREHAETLHQFLKRTVSQGVYWALLALMLRDSGPKFRIGFEEESK